ncbi:heme/copper-type cytochrome/quinol oxidase subunit 4 [Microbacterium natoriense]|uniref:Heme/copper-type cytochrome/quinol oxidase subunit 4 n=1 Tax=Microbacterium natoriense TaxID=284570 RepID=A0AAW8EXK7_9MICO|nr:heme/copper-type cytochrome/quinol oxidase subunit 4 [Microbacterium natoriense]
MPDVAENKSNEIAEPAANWKPTAEAKSKATMFRWIAAVLWAVAIAAEAVGIFWLLRQREYVGEDGKLVRDPDTGLLSEPGVTAHFPQWAFITLLVLLVVIAALSIIGSMLWKKANRLDPARKADKFRFFVQNQLGAIIAVVAFLPLIILIFLNKDMDKGQKTTAGIVGIVLAALAVVLGVDFNPPSIEQYTADQSTVIQLLGKDEVVWVDGGQVYHVCDSVSDVQTGSEIRTGTTAEAIESGKTRLTLEFASELKKCDLAVPENSAEIVEALRAIRDGATETTLPAPVWADSTDAPIQIPDATESPEPAETPAE